MKVEIVRDKCVASGNCVELAGEMFTQSEEDGKVMLIAGDETDDPKVMQAAMLCPVGAIFIDGELP